MRHIQPKESREIRAWMARKGLRATDLAREAGLKQNSGMITHFVNGDRTSEPIRDLFLQKGCPERLLKGLDRLRERRLRKAA